MKNLALSLIAAAGSILPDRAWRLIWKTMLRNDRLIDSQGWQFFGEFADRLNVNSVGVLGEYGAMSSSPHDAVILKEYAQQRRWAATTNALIREFFDQTTGTYFDIGANIGMTTVPIASTTNVVCHAFEPEPTNFKNLSRNVRLNCSGENVTLHQMALFDRKSTLSFELSDSNLGDHRIRLNGSSVPSLLNETTRPVIEVPCVRLDDLDIPVAGRFFAKIDTQGAEPFIIAGGGATLAKADVILTEWSPYLMRRMSGDPFVVIQFLRENFSQGAINQGDATSAPMQPISDLCNALAQTLSSFAGMEYADVVVRK
ncbi:FkbM family methyltransferase [Tardiphaga robiniae]|uniref:FkbM family methyltransferase n=1 Tax=Tardiphaga robiniae TaxID=943830 RepID=A0A7G6TUP5_9BRAD|nr:FkbM family methyltransferase [Tardiphaga robiniae]QND70477.1 FkbM family methyltransferase [Tardiphaga robiniae]